MDRRACRTAASRRSGGGRFYDAPVARERGCSSARRRRRWRSPRRDCDRRPCRRARSGSTPVRSTARPRRGRQDDVPVRGRGRRHARRREHGRVDAGATVGRAKVEPRPCVQVDLQQGALGVPPAGGDRSDWRVRSRTASPSRARRSATRCDLRPDDMGTHVAPADIRLRWTSR